MARIIFLCFLSFSSILFIPNEKFETDKTPYPREKTINNKNAMVTMIVFPVFRYYCFAKNKNKT